MRRAVPLAALLVVATQGVAGAAGPEGAVSDELVRRFFDGGPALLLPAAERERLAAADETERERAARAFLAQDPMPETPGNELPAAIAARRARVLAERLSPFDARGQLLFLRGVPGERLKVECAESYKPLELWSWGSGDGRRTAILYRPAVGAHFAAWRPTDSKRALYTPEVEYLLEQWEELRGRITGRRPDLFFCKHAEEVDRRTGVSGLYGFRRERMTDADVDALFAPPADLAVWVRAALAEPPAAAGLVALPLPESTVSFPAARDQRLLARFRLTFAAGTPLGVVEEAGGKESRIALAGVLERPNGVFEEFRLRFVFPPAAPETPIVVQFERLLRPRELFLARLEVRDEILGSEVAFEHELRVPAEPLPEPEEPPAAVAGQELGLARVDGRDTLVLLPPVDEVVFGLWRAEAIVAGERIRRVVFYRDGRAQLTRSSPPWSAEVRLPNIPEETIVRAEGLDAEGNVVAADEILLNEPRGEPRVRLLAPPRGRRLSGTVRARAAVVVPEGRRVERVEFELNEQVIATLERPPWETTVEVPTGSELAYLAVTATYSDGSRVEDFRVLNSPDFLEQIQVDLVELYVTVTDRDGRLAEGLSAADFRVLDNGRPQSIARFEMVRDLPLTLGLVLDVSGSMRESLVEAKRAAQQFLAQILTPRDRCFAVSFSERPSLLMPLTPDARALEAAFRDLPAFGNTSLHDAIVYSLYQYRGVRGRKAMVLLSDGDDTSSLVPYADALAFAQRSGVAIYTIGLNIGGASLGIRSKLQRLADETGGRTFFVREARELEGVYAEIERELRSQYFLAFSPDPAPKEGERHTLEVQVSGRFKARAARGYTP
jgi:Ca-activated chloride channel homolog